MLGAAWWFLCANSLRFCLKKKSRYNVGTLPLWIPNCIINSWTASSESTRGCPFFCVYVMNFRCANFAFRKKKVFGMSVYLIILYISWFSPDGHDTTFFFFVRVSLSYICFVPFLLFSFRCCDASFCLVSGLYQLSRYSICYYLYLCTSLSDFYLR